MEKQKRKYEKNKPDNQIPGEENASRFSSVFLLSVVLKMKRRKSAVRVGAAS